MCDNGPCYSSAEVLEVAKDGSRLADGQGTRSVWSKCLKAESKSVLWNSVWSSYVGRKWAWRCLAWLTYWAFRCST